MCVCVCVCVCVWRDKERGIFVTFRKLVKRIKQGDRERVPNFKRNWKIASLIKIFFSIWAPCLYIVFHHFIKVNDTEIMRDYFGCHLKWHASLYFSALFVCKSQGCFKTAIFDNETAVRSWKIHLLIKYYMNQLLQLCTARTAWSIAAIAGD